MRVILGIIGASAAVLYAGGDKAASRRAMRGPTPAELEALKANAAADPGGAAVADYQEALAQAESLEKFERFVELTGPGIRHKNERFAPRAQAAAARAADKEAAATAAVIAREKEQADKIAGLRAQLAEYDKANAPEEFAAPFAPIPVPVPSSPGEKRGRKSKKESVPGATEPGATEPGTTEPGATEPGATEPGATEPGATEPGATEPGATEPDATESGVTEPGATEPGDESSEGISPVSPISPIDPLAPPQS